MKKGVLKNFANFTGKRMCWSPFLIKLQALGLELYYKETPTQLVFFKFAKMLRTPILNSICERLLVFIDVLNFKREDDA